MPGLGRVLVKQLVQRRANRHRIKQQNQTYQQAANRCLAEVTQLSIVVRQSLHRLTVFKRRSNFFSYLGSGTHRFSLFIAFLFAPPS